MKRDKNEAKYVFLLIGILTFHLINNFLWLKIDKTLLADDPFWHHLCSHYIYSLLKNGEFFLHPLKCIGSISEYAHQYGIFVQLICAPFYFISGIGQDRAVMVNAGIFLSTLIFSVYGITKRLANSRSGILAAFVISMYPIIFNHSRMFMLDLPLAALVSLSIYLLIRYDLFRKGRYTFLLVLLLGLLIKINFILFIITPLLIILIKGALNFRRKAEIFLFLALAFIPFYFIKRREIFEWLGGNLHLFNLSKWSESLPDIFSYLLRLIDNGLSFLLAITFGIGIRYFIKSNIKEKNLLLSSLILPLLILVSFAHYRDAFDMVRYSMPLLVFSTIITGIGLTNMRPVIFRRFSISLVVIFSFIQFFAVSWGINYLPAEISIQKNSFHFSLFKQNLHIPPARNRFSHPTRICWDANQLWDKIEETKDIKSKFITVVVLDPLCEIFYPLCYRAIVEEMPVNVITVEMTAPNNKGYLRNFTLSGCVLDADYIIATNRPNGVYLAPDYIDSEKKEAEDVFYRNIQNFSLIEKFNLPNKVEVFLYKNLRLEKQK